LSQDQSNTPQPISLNFLENDGIGAWEAAFLWARIGFSDSTDSQEIDTWTVRLNWNLDKSIRAMFNCS